MAIQIPGKRNVHGKRVRPAKRNVVATLQLTAMVDMFTVLAVFLLQNYAVTGEVINISKDVTLPGAVSVKDLKPSNVVVISKKEVMLNNDIVASFEAVKEQEDWMVAKLHSKIQELIASEKLKAQSIGSKIRDVVQKAQGEGEDELPEYLKITIQADQSIDFLTVKKVMFTATEAGVVEINFAVIKETEDDTPPPGA